MTVTLKRSVQIKVTLTADLHARLRDLSEQLGQAPASVAAIAIGEYVRTREVQAGALRAVGELTVERFAPMFQEHLQEQIKLAESEESQTETGGKR